MKPYAWEDCLITSVKEVRTDEMKSIRKAAIVKALNEALFFASSAIISLFALILFSLFF